MAGLLLERSQNDSWIVVFKALVSTHTLMNYGSEVRLPTELRQIKINKQLQCVSKKTEPLQLIYPGTQLKG